MIKVLGVKHKSLIVKLKTSNQMTQKLFNTFHSDVTPKYLQQYIDRLAIINGLKFTGDKITGEDKATVFIGHLSHGICSWTIYKPYGDIELGMFILEKE